MKFVLQPLTIRVTNCDAKSRMMEDSAEKRKHGGMLPSTIRAIICGSSNCGKTNVLISLLESRTIHVSRTCTSIRNRCNSQNTNISKICLRLSTKSATLRSPTTATSFHRVRRVQILFLSLMMWYATSRMR
ncbi:hypothetical protein ALC56_09512 [Trachymyrmex septentrionalis]|uniref:Uncharacterized protein n=1 Tax=Trachymyrmex septentrionalis TaxID=34720 RepID=A0A151JU97_9HYME|nr:hypothetical protein ALC56_09512 [Trachymyrmex septentrionalis]